MKIKRIKPIKKVGNYNWLDGIPAALMFIFVLSLLLRNDIYLQYLTELDNTIKGWVKSPIRDSSNESNEVPGINLISTIKGFNNIGEIYSAFGVLVTIFMAAIAIVLGNDIRQRASNIAGEISEENQKSATAVNHKFIDYQHIHHLKKTVDAEAGVFEVVTIASVILSLIFSAIFICQPMEGSHAILLQLFIVFLRILITIPVPLVFNVLSPIFYKSISEISHTLLQPGFQLDGFSKCLARFEFLRVLINLGKLEVRKGVTFGSILLADADHLYQAARQTLYIEKTKKCIVLTLLRSYGVLLLLMVPISLFSAWCMNSYRVLFILLGFSLTISLFYPFFVYLFTSVYMLKRKSLVFTTWILASISALIIDVIFIYALWAGDMTHPQKAMLILLIVPVIVAIIGTFFGKKVFQREVNNMVTLASGTLVGKYFQLNPVGSYKRSTLSRVGYYSLAFRILVWRQFEGNV